MPRGRRQQGLAARRPGSGKRSGTSTGGVLRLDCSDRLTATNCFGRLHEPPVMVTPPLSLSPSLLPLPLPLSLSLSLSLWRPQRGAAAALPPRASPGPSGTAAAGPPGCGPAALRAAGRLLWGGRRRPAKVYYNDIPRIRGGFTSFKGRLGRKRLRFYGLGVSRLAVVSTCHPQTGSGAFIFPGLTNSLHACLDFA